ncbi:hypothetical protein KUCAC02_030327, partial [Chaenocephalus aceratus]
MAISVDVPLVNSTFGKVQEGSHISYQHHPDAPPPPPLPVDGYRLEPTTYVVESYAEEEVDKSPDEGSLSSTADAGAAKADTSRSYSADAEDSDNNGTFT